jgi:hypothetical protein
MTHCYLILLSSASFWGGWAITVQICNYTVPASLTILTIGSKNHLLKTQGPIKDFFEYGQNLIKIEAEDRAVSDSITTCVAGRGEYLANVVQVIFPQIMYWANVAVGKTAQSAAGA